MLASKYTVYAYHLQKLYSFLSTDFYSKFLFVVRTERLYIIGLRNKYILPTNIQNVLGNLYYICFPPTESNNISFLGDDDIQ